MALPPLAEIAVTKNANNWSNRRAKAPWLGKSVIFADNLPIAGTVMPMPRP